MNGQSKKDIPEKLVHKTKKNKTKTKHNMRWILPYANKHK